MATAIDYARPGPLTSLEGLGPAVLATLGYDPVEICAPVSSLVIQPSEAKTIGLPVECFWTNQVRPALRLIETLLAIDPAPLSSPRPPEQRVVGTCRHFAVIACALLRARGVPSRARCGFATYFQPGQGLDHWVTEYWDEAERRWVRVDSEILGGDVLSRPQDLRPGEFFSGGEAWAAFRRGEIDAGTFGVYGTDNWGPAEIRGNLVRDLAALNKVELLPWDEWGRMGAAYRAETGPDYDELLDTVAEVCAGDDPASVARLYEHDGLRAPLELFTEME